MERDASRVHRDQLSPGTLPTQGKEAPLRLTQVSPGLQQKPPLPGTMRGAEGLLQRPRSRHKNRLSLSPRRPGGGGREAWALRDLVTL